MLCLRAVYLTLATGWWLVLMTTVARAQTEGTREEFIFQNACETGTWFGTCVDPDGCGVGIPGVVNNWGEVDCVGSSPAFPSAADTVALFTDCTLNGSASVIDVDASESTFVLATGSQLTLSGQLTSHELTSIQGTATLTFTEVCSALGNGTIMLVPEGPDTPSVETTGLGSLYFDGTLILEGAGTLSTAMTMYGLTMANVAGRDLRFEAQDIMNMGTFQASNGARLVFSGLTLDNSGSLTADQGTIHLEDGTAVVGGSLSFAHGGKLTSGSGHNLLSMVTLESDLLLDVLGDNSTNPSLEIGADILENDGRIRINPNAASDASLLLANLQDSPRADLTLVGDGELILSAGGVLEVPSGDRLLHGSYHTIRGAGSVLADLVNSWLITADVPGSVLELDPHTSTGIVNQAWLRAETGATLRIRDGAWFDHSAPGILQVNGILSSPDSGLTLVSGLLTGQGVVQCDLTTLAAQVMPGDMNPGTLTIQGDYVHGFASGLGIRLGGTLAGTEHDLLNVTGSVLLSGTLAVIPVQGFIPQPGQTFTILQGAPVTGTFNQLVSSGSFQVSYSPTSVTLTVLTSPRSPDLIPDGIIDTRDLVSLITAMPGIPAENDRADEDLDGNGTVGLEDLDIATQSWNYSVQQ